MAQLIKKSDSSVERFEIHEGGADVARTPATLFRAQATLSWLTVAAGLVTMAVAAYCVVLAWTPVPYWDQWSSVESMLHTMPAAPLHWLWMQHNEHRILVPKLFLLTEYFVFHGQQKFLLCSTYLTQCASLALLVWAFYRFGKMTRLLWITCAGVAACLLFAPIQIDNLAVGFQIAFVVCLFFQIASSVALLVSEQDGPEQGVRWGWLAVCVICGVLAMYSMAAGVMTLPLVIAAAIALRMPRKAIAVLVICFLAALGSYLYHYVSPPGHTNPISALRRPVQMAEYVAIYFGGALFNQRLKLDALAGALGLLVSACLGAATLWRKRSPFPVLLVMLQAFCVGTALLSALGRLDFGVAQAVASRYATFGLLFWLSLVVMVVWRASQSIAFSRRVVGLQALLLLCVALGAVEFRPAVRHVLQQALRDNAGGAALMAGVADPDALGNIFPLPQFVLDLTPTLRQKQWTVFGTREFQTIGQPLSNVYSETSPQACMGTVDIVQAVGAPTNAGLRLMGWAVDSRTMGPPKRIVPVVDGVITGSAAIGVFRGDVKSVMHTRKADVGWIAFVPDKVSGKKIRFYAITKRGGACEFAQKVMP